MQPVFAREQLFAGQSCEFEIVDTIDGCFAIGVATADLRNTVNKCDSNHSLCVLADDGTLYYNCKQQKHHFMFKIGDKVAIRNNSERIEWVRDG